MPIKIKEKDSVIEKRIVEAMLDVINSAVINSTIRIKDGIRNIVREAIMIDSITGQSILGGFLYGGLGFPRDAERRLLAIVNTIVDNVNIEFKPFRYRAGKISGYFKVQILRADFKDLLSLSEATVITEKRQNLPWLEWLLIEGNHKIISDYVVLFRVGTGRSGDAIMVPFPTSSWSIPDIHAGTIAKNWLTRAVQSEKFEMLLSKLIETEISRYF